MPSGDDPRFDDSTETELRTPDEATRTSGPSRTGLPADEPTLAAEGAGGALPDLGLVTVPREQYLVEGEIARGGMGRVLAARDRRLGRPVALKELLSSSPEMAARFEREALMTARLQHPSIVNVHEAGRWPSGEPFYAMKRVVGRPLDKVVRDAGSVEERLALLPKVLAVAEALAYAHEQGVIHRDLKPANVLVGSFGETVVVDWGLAKDLLRAGAFEETQGTSGGGGSTEDSGTPHATPDALTVVGTVLGTPSYMAPEQARGEALDERADVYALGAILYTVLAGSPPYVGPSSTAVLAEVLKGPPVPLEERQAGLPEDLLAIVRKAMSARKEDRYRTAGELTEDLRRYQTGQLVGAHRYGAGELVRRWASKHRGAVAVATAAVLALAIGGALAVQRVRSERDRAERERAEALARNDELVLAQARSSLETDPTASLAWLKHYSPDGPHWGAVRMIAADARSRGIARRVLPGHDAEVRELAFSPDGKQLASVGNDYALRLWSVEGGSGRLLFRSNWHARSVEFSPDGSHIAFGHGLGRVGVWDVRTGRFDGSADGASEVEWLRFLPGGRALLLVGRAVSRWNLADRMYRFQGKPVGDWTPDVALGPDRRQAATRSEKGEVMVWDLETGHSRLVSPALKESNDTSGGLAFWGDGVAFGTGTRVRLAGLDGRARRTLDGHQATVRAVAASRDGSWLATGGDDWTVRLWARDGSAVRVLRGHSGPVRSLSFSPDGRTLASASDRTDTRVLLWDVATGRNRVLSGDTARDLAFSPDGALIATSDHKIRLWSVAGADTEEWPAGDPPSRDARIAVAPDGAWVASGDHDRPLRLWHLADKTSQVLMAWPGRLDTLEFSRDGRTLAAAGTDGVVRVWSLPGLTRREFRGHVDRVSSLTFSPDSGELASASEDKTLRLWNLATGAARVLKGHESWAFRVTYSPDGSLLASASAAVKFNSGAKPDKGVRVWDRTTGRVRVLEGHSDIVTWVDFSPDGRTLASASMDHTVRLWNLADGASRVLSGHGDLVFQVAFSTDGRRLISTSNDNTTRVWDLATGTSRVFPKGFYGLGPSAFSPNGATLCRYGDLWDLASGEGRRLAPEDYVGQPVFSPQGRLIVARMATGGLRVWRDDLPTDPAHLRTWLTQSTDLAVEPGGAGPPR